MRLYLELGDGVLLDETVPGPDQDVTVGVDQNHLVGAGQSQDRSGEDSSAEHHLSLLVETEAALPTHH